MMYEVYVEILGEDSSFSGRSISVQGEVAREPEPVVLLTEYNEIVPNILRTSVRLCTSSPERFRDADIRIEVGGRGSVVNTLVERVACRLNPDIPKEEANSERYAVMLLPDGSIDVQFGDTPFVEAICRSYGNQFICEDNTL